MMHSQQANQKLIFDISEHLVTLHVKLAHIQHEDHFLSLSHLLNTDLFL